MLISDPLPLQPLKPTKKIRDGRVSWKGKNVRSGHFNKLLRALLAGVRYKIVLIRFDPSYEFFSIIYQFFKKVTKVVIIFLILF